MRANSFCAAVFCLFFVFLVGTTALEIQTPLILNTGLNRLNFTKGRNDPAGAFFNIAVASNATRLADDVDLSVGFVDINILVLPGKYSIFAMSNETQPAYLGNTEDFVVIYAPVPPTSTAPSATSHSTRKASATFGAVKTASSSASNSSIVAPSTSPPPIGMIIGIVLGVFGMIVVLILLFFFLRRRKQQQGRNNGLEAPGPMLQSSVSLSSGSYPSNHINPFMTPSSTSTSLSSPQQRQQHITNEMRLVRKQMEELRRTGNSSTYSFSAPTSTFLSSPVSSSDTNALDLERSRQQNDALQSRIAQLEDQLQSAWALGLSNDPPPGYVA